MAKKAVVAADDLASADLGDARRTNRLAKIAAALDAKPGLGLPQAMGTIAALEAAYRLFSNEDVTWEAVLDAHVSATANRVAIERQVYVVHDTTEFRFGGDAREEVGTLQAGGVGFLGHVALAVSADGARRPLGVLAFEPIVRTERKRKKRGKKRSVEAKRSDPQRESLKWVSVLGRASAALGARGSPIHLMDREADIYSLFAGMVERGDRFVVRVGQDRAVRSGEETVQLFDALDDKRIRFRREVPISPRKHGDRQHPARDARVAELGYAAARLEVKRPGKVTEGPETLVLNFVHVVEIDPPESVTPIDWKLVTTEKIGTTQDIEAIVDAYRARWVIEEFFKALKTGCNIERAQLESLHALLNYVAVHLPIATRLLALRSLERHSPESPASTVLSSLELEVLREISPRPPPRKATVSDAVRSIAALGGHIPNNGSPGWIVLGRGFAELVRCVALFERIRAKKSDQS